jgi:broad specificity phosphatase PhoE
VHNPRDILYGRLPRFRLSDDGHRQAHDVGRFVATRAVTAIYSSPLLRARQTAEIIAAYQPTLRVRTSRALLETRSSYQGEPNAILKAGFSFYEPKKDPSDESMRDIWERMVRFLGVVVRRHAGGCIVLVSHADPITILRVGLEARELTVKNLHAVAYAGRASVTELVIESGRPLTMTYFNVGESADGSAMSVSRSGFA